MHTIIPRGFVSRAYLSRAERIWIVMVGRGQGGVRREADFYEADNGVCNLNLKQKEGEKKL